MLQLTTQMVPYNRKLTAILTATPQSVVLNLRLDLGNSVLGIPVEVFHSRRLTGA